MEEKMMLAQQAAENIADEATTIAKYTKSLNDLITAGDEDAASSLKEIISDELNHIVKFAEMYVALTGIDVSED